MRIVSSLDLGTNSALLLIMQCSHKDYCDHQACTVLYDTATIVRTGEGVDKTHMLSIQAMERTMLCLQQYAHIIESFGGNPSQTICVATSQARDAHNAIHFFDEVRIKTGFVFITLTGKQESTYTFLGALLPGMKAQQTAVIDVGGGSTELVDTMHAQSLNMGAVRFTERFFKHDPVTDKEFEHCIQEIDQMIGTSSEWQLIGHNAHILCGVAGSITTLGAWQIGLKRFDAQKVNGISLTRVQVEQAIDILKRHTYLERQTLIGEHAAGRADILLAGSLIVWRVMEAFSFPTLVVSTQGLRYGIIGGIRE